MKYIEYKDRDFAEFETLISLINERNGLSRCERSEELSADALVDKIASLNGKIYLAKNEFGIVGVICGYIQQDFEDNDVGVISHILVRQKFCGQGIGKKLLKQMERYFERNGCVRFSADVILSDPKTVAFWDSNNYCKSVTNYSKECFENTFRSKTSGSSAPIERLEGANIVRKRSSVIFDGKNKDACMKVFCHLLRYSIDEAIHGFGNKIIVRSYKDGSISIRDFSRGIDIGFSRADGEPVYDMFTELGDSHNDSRPGQMYGEAYGNYYSRRDYRSLGAIQMVSSFMNVRVVRGESARCLAFERGEFINSYNESAEGEPDGTYIRFAFDPLVFAEYTLSDDDILNIIKTEAVTAAGTEFVYINKDLHMGCFQYAGGTNERFAELSRGTSPNPLVAEKSFIGSDEVSGHEYSAKAKIIFGMSTHGFREIYHNYRFISHGEEHIYAIEHIFLKRLNDFISSSEDLCKKIDKIRAYEYVRHRLLIVETYSELTSFATETGKRIFGKLISDNCDDMICRAFDKYLSEHRALIEDIIERILCERKTELLTADGLIECKLYYAAVDYHYGNKEYLCNLLKNLPLNDSTLSMLTEYSYISEIRSEIWNRYADIMSEEMYREYKHFYGKEYPEVCARLDAKFHIDKDDDRHMFHVEKEKKDSAHNMMLAPEPFDKIRRGKKWVELRLYDEKRKLVKEGDYIRFSKIDRSESVMVKVIKLHIYPSFKELYDDFRNRSEIYLLGYGRNDNADPNDMNKYYLLEDQKKYGVVGIEFERPKMF